jgi:serine/threonine protein phosphatase PrpC
LKQVVQDEPWESDLDPLSPHAFITPRRASISISRPGASPAPIALVRGGHAAFPSWPGNAEMATLSTSAPTCEIASRTDTGRVRSANEDAVRFDAKLGLAILADGMGGYAAGEVASRMAVDEIFDELASALPHLHAEPVSHDRAGLHEDMRFAAARANASILTASRREPDYEGMGSTLVVAVLMHDRVTVSHLGDSRAYRFRAGVLEQLTRDHGWVDEQIAMGALPARAILDSRYRNIVTRALGIEEQVDLEIHDHEALVGDIFLLCSDGLTDMLDDVSIADHLAAQRPLAETASTLVDAANEAGGRDNVSALLLQVGTPQSPGWAARLVRRLQGGA